MRTAQQAGGQLAWSRALTAAPLAELAASDGRLYLGTATSLVALDALTGAPRWSTSIIPSAAQEGTRPADANTAVALTASGDRVYVLAKRSVAQGDGAAWEANVYQIDATDGTHLEREGVRKRAVRQRIRAERVWRHTDCTGIRRHDGQPRWRRGRGVAFPAR